MFRRLGIGLMLLCLPALHGAAVSAQPSVLEYDVKAVFLLNFSRYVTWPAARLTPPFRICVVDPNPFGRRLTAAVDGERWQGAPVEVLDIESLRDAQACHLLYVPSAATDHFIDAQKRYSVGGVLTVGETRDFLTQGGMVRLFLENNRVRFSVNQSAAESAGLQISSRLLRLARSVVSHPEKRR
jgi:hypothetical protein